MGVRKSEFVKKTQLLCFNIVGFERAVIYMKKKLAFINQYNCQFVSKKIFRRWSVCYSFL